MKIYLGYQLKTDGTEVVKIFVLGCLAACSLLDVALLLLTLHTTSPPLIHSLIMDIGQHHPHLDLRFLCVYVYKCIYVSHQPVDLRYVCVIQPVLFCSSSWLAPPPLPPSQPSRSCPLPFLTNAV